MSKVTELLNQITGWIQQYNPEEFRKIDLDSGLTSDRIESYLEGKPFTFPTEIVELYQWRNGRGYGSFFVDAGGGYDEQESYSLALGLGLGEEWEQDYCPGTPLLALFSFEDLYYWTKLPSEPQEFAPIYVSDDADFDAATPSFLSLTAMLEKRATRLKFIWKID